MYSTFIFIHSWLRWALLILGLIVIIKAYIGWIGNKKYSASDDATSIVLMALFHTQLLIGLLLYLIFSPLTHSAFQDFGAAMKDGQLRYWTIEHSFIMFFSILIAQFGRIRIKKAHSALNKHRNTAIYFTLALILILSRIPWDQTTRLFRGFTS